MELALTVFALIAIFGLLAYVFTYADNASVLRLTLNDLGMEYTHVGHLAAQQQRKTAAIRAMHRDIARAQTNLTRISATPVNARRRILKGAQAA